MLATLLMLAAAPDYAAAQSWLCRPELERADACNRAQLETQVTAKGERIPYLQMRPIRPGFDCFYVYPTVSRDEGRLSDLSAGPEEGQVAWVQATPFEKHCRMFAPLYRQTTLTALRGAMLGGAPISDAERETGFADVKAAWAHYLKHDNGGRGVVLIGHSQGARVLKRLLAEEIEGKPTARLLISAMLIGHDVAVPAGRDVGGDLKGTPLCRSTTQTGCVVSYVSFRADSPPPANTRFGRPADPALRSACTNPADLARGGPAPLQSYFVTSGMGETASPQPAWLAGRAIETPFVSTPGLIEGRCVSDANGTYLAITVKADPADPRADAIGGDVQAFGRRLDDWGLHLIDMNLAMGDLVELSAQQAASWFKANPQAAPRPLPPPKPGDPKPMMAPLKPGTH